MSVYDNMAFGLENLAVPRPEIETQGAGGGHACCGCERLLQRKPDAALGRPAPARGDWPRHRARPASLFLFDEPLSNLDAELRVSMRAELRELHAAARQRP